MAASPRTTLIGDSTAGFPTSKEGYQIKCEIGRGAYAKVFLARCPLLDTDVAIKVIELDTIVLSLEDVAKEVRIMMLCKDSNVLSAHASFVVGSSLWLVLPLMRKGSCLRIMRYLRKSGKREGLDEEWIASIMRGALEGLEYIHKQFQVHRDFKAGNLLMDSDGKVVVCDLGVATWLNGVDRRENRKTFIGTPCWMAPEVMEHEEGYDEKADIWSVGITLLELAKGYPPYANMQPLKVLMKTLKDPPPSLKTYETYKKGEFSRQFSEIVAMCLQKDPKLRPSCSQLLQKSFFKKAKPSSVLVKDLLEALEVPDVDVLPDLSTAPFAITPGPGLLEAASTAASASSVSKPPKEAAPELSKPKGFVHGSTWVFDDDDTVKKDPKSKKTEEKVEITDDFAKLMQASGLPGEE